MTHVIILAVEAAGCKEDIEKAVAKAALETSVVLKVYDIHVERIEATNGD